MIHKALYGKVTTHLLQYTLTYIPIPISPLKPCSNHYLFCAFPKLCNKPPPSKIIPISYFENASTALCILHYENRVKKQQQQQKTPLLALKSPKAP